MEEKTVVLNNEKILRASLMAVGEARVSAEAMKVGTPAEIAGNTKEGQTALRAASIYFQLMKVKVDSIKRGMNTRFANLRGAASEESVERDGEEDFLRATDEGVEAAAEGRGREGARSEAYRSDQVSADLVDIEEKLDYVCRILDPKRTESLSVIEAERLVRYGVQLLEPDVRSEINTRYAGGREFGGGSTYEKYVPQFLRQMDARIEGHPYTEAIRTVSKVYGVRFADRLDGRRTWNAAAMDYGEVAAIMKPNTKREEPLDLSTDAGLAQYRANVAKATLIVPEGTELTDRGARLLQSITDVNVAATKTNTSGLAAEIRERWHIDVHDGMPADPATAMAWLSDPGKAGEREKARVKALGAEGIPFGSLIACSGPDTKTGEALKDYMKAYEEWTARGSRLFVAANVLSFIPITADDTSRHGLETVVPFGRVPEIEAVNMKFEAASAVAGTTLSSGISSLNQRLRHAAVVQAITGMPDSGSMAIAEKTGKAIASYISRGGDELEKELRDAIAGMSSSAEDWFRESLDGARGEGSAAKAMSDAFALAMKGDVGVPDTEKAVRTMKDLMNAGDWDTGLNALCVRQCSEMAAALSNPATGKAYLEGMRQAACGEGNFPENTRRLAFRTAISVLGTMPETAEIIDRQHGVHDAAVRENAVKAWKKGLDGFRDALAELEPEFEHLHETEPGKVFGSTAVSRFAEAGIKFNRAFLGNYMDAAVAKAAKHDREFAAAAGTSPEILERARESVIRAITDATLDRKKEHSFGVMKQAEDRNMPEDIFTQRRKYRTGTTEMNPFTRGPALVFENAPDEIAARLSTASAGIDDADERKMTDALAMAALAGMTPEANAVYERTDVKSASALLKETENLVGALDTYYGETSRHMTSERGLLALREILESVPGTTDPVRTPYVLDGAYPALGSISLVAGKPGAVKENGSSLPDYIGKAEPAPAKGFPVSDMKTPADGFAFWVDRSLKKAGLSIFGIARKAKQAIRADSDGGRGRD